MSETRGEEDGSLRLGLYILSLSASVDTFDCFFLLFCCI